MIGQNSDWRESLNSAIKKKEDLNLFLGTSFKTDYPLFLPLKLANKIKEKGPTSVLWKQFVPQDLEESIEQNAGFLDPIGDQIYQKSSQIIHRYHNRVLFLPLVKCPVICRYCFRKNELDLNHFEGDLFKPNITQTLEYLQSHSEIEELIFSGGDPLLLSDQKIDFYLNSFSQIKSLKYIRFHTRVPVILPERISAALIEVLEKYKQRFVISFAIHCNHFEEIGEEEAQAILKLNGIVQLLSQTVLLKNINNDASILRQLFIKFYSLNIRPYYLHHPDLVKGGMHFYLEVKEGRKIFKELRQLLPGWLLPQYVLDHPEGRGKENIGLLSEEPISYLQTGLL